MKKIGVFIVILLGVNVSLLAQNDARGMFNPVLTGVTSLSIAPDSRAGAMGDVGVATDPDVNSNIGIRQNLPLQLAQRDSRWPIPLGCARL